MLFTSSSVFLGRYRHAKVVVRRRLAEFFGVVRLKFVHLFTIQIMAPIQDRWKLDHSTLRKSHLLLSDQNTLTIDWTGPDEIWPLQWGPPHLSRRADLRAAPAGIRAGIVKPLYPQLEPHFS